MLEHFDYFLITLFCALLKGYTNLLRHAYCTLNILMTLHFVHPCRLGYTLIMFMITIVYVYLYVYVYDNYCLFCSLAWIQCYAFAELYCNAKHFSPRISPDSLQKSRLHTGTHVNVVLLIYLLTSQLFACNCNSFAFLSCLLFAYIYVLERNPRVQKMWKLHHCSSIPGLFSWAFLPLNS